MNPSFGATKFMAAHVNRTLTKVNKNLTGGQSCSAEKRKPTAINGIERVGFTSV
jgi:hypothetical protein